MLVKNGLFLYMLNFSGNLLKAKGIIPKIPMCSIYFTAVYHYHYKYEGSIP